MKVDVKIVGVLRKYFERDCEVVELPEGATAADLLSRLSAPPWIRADLLFIVINEHFAAPSNPLAEGDCILFMLPVGGG